MITFRELGLIEPLLGVLRDETYLSPTPVQAQSIPPLLEGRDLLGCARTGTGKTAAFALPILQSLSATAGPAQTRGRSVRALVLVPTRELAAQVCASFAKYGRRLRLTVAVVYGGVGQGEQVRALARGVDILVATPGRLLDLMGQGYARLERVEVLVLDEADHMLDMGFIPDVRRIVRALPARRQTLLFSATMPPQIATLADRMLSMPVRIVVTPSGSTVEEVDQRVHFVSSEQKPALLTSLLSGPSVLRALVFTRTKRGADRVARRLAQTGIAAAVIHGNKSQNARDRSLHDFRHGRTRVLVATDIAARGIDVEGITHVINFELPNVPESYVHRIGRTARKGASGVAISLCDPAERVHLREIELLTRLRVRVVEDSTGARRNPDRDDRAPLRVASHVRPGVQRDRSAGRRQGPVVRRSRSPRRR